MLKMDDIEKNPLNAEFGNTVVYFLKQKIKTPFDWVRDTYVDKEEEVRDDVQVKVNDTLDNMPGHHVWDMNLGFVYKRYDMDKYIIIYGSWRQKEDSNAYNDLLIKIFPKTWDFLKVPIAKSIDKEATKLWGIDRVTTYFGPWTALREPAISLRIKDGMLDPVTNSKLMRLFDYLKTL